MSLQRVLRLLSAAATTLGSGALFCLCSPTFISEEGSLHTGTRPRAATTVQSIASLHLCP
jgi:hypothetical protein